MRVMIFGASGLLGKALLHEWRDDEVIGLSSHDVDIRDAQGMRKAVGERHPEWIVLSAAYTDVDGCESNRELAFAINCEGAVNIGRAAREVGSRLMFLSTDYVFDGSKRTPYEITDARNPASTGGSANSPGEGLRPMK